MQKRRRASRAGPTETSAVLLAAERAVDPCERLHEGRALHRLVDVDGVQRRGVKAGEQHRLDNEQLQVVVGVHGALLITMLCDGRRMCFFRLTPTDIRPLVPYSAGGNHLPLPDGAAITRISAS
jgi:hypothetical protein